MVVTAGGQGDGAEHFWFLATGQLLVLKRIDGQWVWQVTRFKVESSVAADKPAQVAMWLASGEQDLSVKGRALVLHAGKLYDSEALKLNPPEEAE